MDYTIYDLAEENPKKAFKQAMEMLEIHVEENLILNSKYKELINMNDIAKALRIRNDKLSEENDKFKSEIETLKALLEERQKLIYFLYSEDKCELNDKGHCTVHNWYGKHEECPDKKAQELFPDDRYVSPLRGLYYE